MPSPQPLSSVLLLLLLMLSFEAIDMRCFHTQFCTFPSACFGLEISLQLHSFRCVFSFCLMTIIVFWYIMSSRVPSGVSIFALFSLLFLAREKFFYMSWNYSVWPSVKSGKSEKKTFRGKFDPAFVPFWSKLEDKWINSIIYARWRGSPPTNAKRQENLSNTSTPSCFKSNEG